MSLLVDTSADTTVPLLLGSAAGVLALPDAAPTFRVYGPSGLVGSGALTAPAGGTITDAGADSSNIEIASAAHGLTPGAVVDISGVLGTTEANGRRVVQAGVTADTFDIPVTWVHVYTGGGVWVAAGLWELTIDGSLRSALEPGVCYLVAVEWAESAVNKAESYHLVPQ